MLIIYGAFRLGGIETYFLRLAKEYKENGKEIKFLFLSDKWKSDSKLVSELEKYSEVNFLMDILKYPLLSFFRAPFSLIYPLSMPRIENLLSNVRSVHTSDVFSALVAHRLINLGGVKIPITTGIYHEKQFTWGNKRLPLFEKFNREYFFNVLSKENIFTFNSSMIDLYSKKGFDISGAQYFPLGVIEDEGNKNLSFSKKPSHLNIVSVGRLTNFKTYNLWMLDVIYELKRKGIQVAYYIYGDGELKGKIEDLIHNKDLKDCVFLKGEIAYKEFSNIGKYDAFVGSGTALIEAASLGLPCIVGIESIKHAESYDFFSKLPGTSYNEDHLFPKKSMDSLFTLLNNMSEDEYSKLCYEHVEKAKLFSMSVCRNNFELATNRANIDAFKLGLLNRVIYSLSYAFALVEMRINPNSQFSKKYCS